MPTDQAAGSVHKLSRRSFRSHMLNASIVAHRGELVWLAKTRAWRTILLLGSRSSNCALFRRARRASRLTSTALPQN
jgi:hypothetical protein